MPSAIIITASIGLLAVISGGTFAYWVNKHDELGYPAIACLPWQDCPTGCEENPTDHQFNLAALSTLINMQNDSVVQQMPTGETVIATVQKYETVEEFLAVNPDCCDFQLGSPRDAAGPIPLNLQRKHDYYGYVTVRYEFRVILHDGIEYLSDATTEIPMNSCGQTIHWGSARRIDGT